MTDRIGSAAYYYFYFTNFFGRVICDSSAKRTMG